MIQAQKVSQRLGNKARLALGLPSRHTVWWNESKGGQNDSEERTGYISKEMRPIRGAVIGNAQSIRRSRKLNNPMVKIT